MNRGQIYNEVIDVLVQKNNKDNFQNIFKDNNYDLNDSIFQLKTKLDTIVDNFEEESECKLFYQTQLEKINSIL